AGSDFWAHISAIFGASHDAIQHANLSENQGGTGLQRYDTVRAELGHAFMLQAGRLQFQPMYSSQVLDHFENPRNAGEVPDPDVRVRLENPACGDILELTAKIKDGVVT